MSLSLQGKASGFDEVIALQAGMAHNAVATVRGHTQVTASLLTNGYASPISTWGPIKMPQGFGGFFDLIP